ncbi:MAG: PDZ domain-containing protein [Candidatus Obscuribacterales bacterium]|nr:PDZ domain-containing protein [Candidatus Obscuribacterales bacterium]
MKKLILGMAAALMFAFSGTPASYAQQAPASKSVQQQQFDGKLLYSKAFEAIRELHIKLDSKDKLDAFTKEWEHKFDQSGELNSEDGTDRAILKMMQSFGQRFDYFFDKQATEAEAQQVDATLTGIGATLKLSKLAEIAKTLPKDAKPQEVKKAIEISNENFLQIEEPMDGSPALKAGLKPGDIIRKVDGKSLVGMQMDEAIKLIKGKSGTFVTLGIERDGKSLAITVGRARVTVPTVKFKDMGNGISYVKLNDFMSKNAVQEMYMALSKAASGKGLILDLRGNPGGSLPAVLTMSGMLIEDGPVLVTRSRDGDRIVDSELTLNKNFVLRTEPSAQNPNEMEVSTGPRPKLVIPSDMPIIVLVDEGSASASEILSGALQHNRRAIVVGMPTVGKGVGQTVIQLPFGRSLHVTSFEFIPGRTPNDWIGVIPNVKIERGSDPKVDQQLEKAKELIAPMLKAEEDNRIQRDEQLKKHQEEFSKVLSERNKN